MRKKLTLFLLAILLLPLIAACGQQTATTPAGATTIAGEVQPSTVPTTGPEVIVPEETMMAETAMAETMAPMETMTSETAMAGNHGTDGNHDGGNRHRGCQWRYEAAEGRYGDGYR